MDKKIIYGVTALFDSPDHIIKAAEQTGQKYKNYDVHTPYPIHGMPKAMNLKPSKLGYFALAFGLTGTALAILLMWWTMSIEYPMIIGGKPFFALPAFIPVAFEVTVLLASVGSVLAMLFILFKLPNNSHPLHDTDYMRAVSVDKYGICIEAKDDNFVEDAAKEFLSSLGGKHVETICFDEEFLTFKPKVFEPKFMMFLIGVFIIISGSTYFVLNKLLYMTPFDWMMEQSRVNAQSASTFFNDGAGMQKPVEGTVALGKIPYQYPDEPELAAVMMVNPLNANESNLMLGKKKYDTYCSPCHGFHGEGDSRLKGQFPNPPSLHTDRIRQWTDGRIYHVIEMGQGIMPSYASQLPKEERWAVILYIRALERSLNAKEGDL